jgi:hypothetical protein
VGAWLCSPRCQQQLQCGSLLHPGVGIRGARSLSKRWAAPPSLLLLAGALSMPPCPHAGVVAGASLAWRPPSTRPSTPPNWTRPRRRFRESSQLLPRQARVMCGMLRHGQLRLSACGLLTLRDPWWLQGERGGAPCQRDPDQVGRHRQPAHGGGEGAASGRRRCERPTDAAAAAAAISGSVEAGRGSSWPAPVSPSGSREPCQGMSFWSVWAASLDSRRAGCPAAQAHA